MIYCSPMPYPERDDDDAELDDRDLPDRSDTDGGDESEFDSDTEPCPFCRKPVYADADLCPHCGNFIALAEATDRKRAWFLVALALSLLIVLTWILLG